MDLMLLKSLNWKKYVNFLKEFLKDKWRHLKMAWIVHDFKSYCWLLSSSAYKGLGSCRSTLTTSKTSKKLTDWKINNSSEIHTKDKATGQATVLKVGEETGQANTENNNLPEQRLMSGNYSGNQGLGRKPWIYLINCWRLCVDKSDS